MALNTISRIHSKGAYRYEEHVAAGTISPGMLITVDSDNKVAANAASSTACEALFAMEDALQGNTVEDDYSLNNVVVCILPAKGSVVNALLCTGTDYTVGTKVASNGDGTLKADNTGAIAVIEDSACDLTDSLAVDTLHPVRIL
jgi:hypothetical protein